MLILINTELHDIGDPLDTLTACGVADLRVPSMGRLVQLGQDAAYAAGGVERAHPGIRRVLAAYMALAGEANCALFLRPAKARSPREVAVRFAHAPLLTMAFLYNAQQGGLLDAALINQHVWQVAPGTAAA